MPRNAAPKVRRSTSVRNAKRLPVIDEKQLVPFGQTRWKTFVNFSPSEKNRNCRLKSRYRVQSIRTGSWFCIQRVSFDAEMKFLIPQTTSDDRLKRLNFFCFVFWNKKFREWLPNRGNRLCNLRSNSHATLWFLWWFTLKMNIYLLINFQNFKPFQR